MRQSHRQAFRNDARAALQWCGVPIGADFHALPSASVDKLLICARNRRYQKPANANGSKARYFHDLLQRHAAIPKESGQ